MISGFDDIQLMELGFKQQMVGKSDYYFKYEGKGFDILSRECYSELELGEGYSLIILHDDIEKVQIKDARDFTDIVRIFSK